MTTYSWLRGHPAIIIGRDELAAYLGDGVASTENGPVEAYVSSGAGYQALVIHDPESTTFIETKTGGVAAQLIHANDKDTALGRLSANIPSDGWRDLGVVYELKGADAVLFDANYAGAELTDPDARSQMKEMGVDPINIPLPEGCYSVHAQTKYCPTPAEEWTLIELRFVGDQAQR